MKDYPEDQDDKLLDYLEGDLSTQEIHEFERELFGDTEAHKRLDEYRTVMEGMESTPTIEPSKKLTEQFFQTIEAEKKKQQPNTPVKKIRHLFHGNWWMQAAAAVLLFFVGYFVDKRISVEELRTEEISSLKEEIASTKHMVMLSMLSQKSASRRLKAVDYSYDIPENDVNQQLLEALIHTMNYDENINVRMAATEAIFRFSDEETIRMAMVKSLKEQTEPEMQILLIDMLVQLKEQKALGVFQTLAKQDDVMEIVKSKAYEGLEVLL